MKKLLILPLLLLLSSNTTFAQIPNDYTITAGTPVPRHIIESYLSRSIQIQSFAFPLFFHNGGRSGLLPTQNHNLVNCQNVPQFNRIRDIINQTNPKMLALADGDWDRDVWYMGDDHWDHVDWFADMVHNIDPEIIIEAGLYEHIRTDDFIFVTLGDDPDEAYIFQEWGNDPDWPTGQTQISISANDMAYDEMIYARYNLSPSNDQRNPHWFIPDMSKLHTRIYWYWRMCEYLRRGFESFHLGRMDLMLKRDCDNLLIADLVQRVRDFAATNARRGHVFFNSQHLTSPQIEHIPGCIPLSACQTPLVPGSCLGMDRLIWTLPEVYFHKNQVYHFPNDISTGNLLWDWGGSVMGIVESNPPAPVGGVWPQTIINNVNDITQVKIRSIDDPQFKVEQHKDIVAPYGYSTGGYHPQGWICDHMPYTVGWDNTHGGDAPIQYTQSNFTYNMDDKTWFISLPNLSDRTSFITYAYSKVKCLDRNGFFSMPGSWHRRLVMDPTHFPFVTMPLGFNPFPEYVQTTPMNDERYWFASDGTPNMLPTIKGIWDNDIHHSDRNSRFNSVNRRDGTTFPTFSWTENTYTGDFNRDGKDDLLVTANYFNGQSFNNWQGYKMCQANTTGDDFDISGPYAEVPLCPPPAGPYLSWGEEFYVGDFDGNGFKDEIAVVSNAHTNTICPNGLRIYKALTTPNGSGGFNFAGFQYTGFSLPYPSWDDRIYIGDFNGDGRDDILATADNTSPVLNTSYSGFRILYNTYATSYNFSSPVSFSYCNTGCTSWGEDFYIGDYDGDGTDDFFVVANPNTGTNWNGLELYSSTFHPSGIHNFAYRGNITNKPSGAFPSWGEQYYVGDFDNDGKDDFIATADKHHNVSWDGYRVFMNKTNVSNYVFKDKGVHGTNGIHGNQCYFPSWGERFNIADFNGDGNSDFLVTADYSLNIDWKGWEMYWSKANLGSWKPGKPENQDIVSNDTLTFNGSSKHTYPHNEIIEKNENVSVYPNPADNKLTFSINNSARQKCEIQINSIDGRIVCQKTINSNTDDILTDIDISGLAKGIYIYQVQIGLKQVTGKFSKL